MKAELLVEATTASACARVRLEAGDSSCICIQRCGEHAMLTDPSLCGESRGRLSIESDMPERKVDERAFRLD